MSIRWAPVYPKASPGLSLCCSGLTCLLEDDELADDDVFEDEGVGVEGVDLVIRPREPWSYKS
jgi:hypothetical protein